MSLDYRRPLPKKIYKRICEHANRTTFKHPLNYLEDCLTHASIQVEGSLTKPDYYKEQQEKEEPEFALINRFYIASLFRYLQKTTGEPKDIQLYHDFDIEKDNQIDKFLVDYFGV